MFRALVGIILLLLSFPSLAQEKLCGPATAKDGDDLEIGDHRIRLHGVDAFELRQPCTGSDGKSWPCGKAALQKLEELIAGSEVCCQRMQAKRSRGRVVMRCMVGGKDLGRELVLVGLAFDCPAHSHEHYKADEAVAKAGKAGAWAGTFRPPWLQKGKTYCCTDEFPRQFCP